MRPNKFIAGATGAVLYAVATLATAATVTFSNFVDDGSPTLFDPGDSSGSNIDIDGNKLTLTPGNGLNNFEADGSSVATQAANDTLTFIVTAPTNYFITSVSYTEQGSGTTGEGVAIATGSMVADGTPRNFLTQVFGENTASGWSITPSDIPIANKQQIAVSISNNLFAISLGGGAFIEKTMAELEVGIQVIPVPPAFGMLGAALVGLATIGMRRRAAS